jgi:hypothetical protein
MAIEFKQTVATQGITDWIRVDATGRAGHAFFIVVDLTADGGSIVDVEFAVEKDLNSSPVCIQHNILKNISVSTASNLHVPISAIRMNVIKYGAGTISLRVLQHED